VRQTRFIYCAFSTDVYESAAAFYAEFALQTRFIYCAFSTDVYESAVKTFSKAKAFFKSF